MRERTSACVSGCVCERERVCVCECVCVKEERRRERGRRSEHERTRVTCLTNRRTRKNEKQDNNLLPLNAKNDQVKCCLAIIRVFDTFDNNNKMRDDKQTWPEKG